MTASLTAPATALAAWTRDWLAALPAPSGDLAAVQQRGRQALADLPVPGSRQEDWRFTDLGLLAQLPPAPPSPEGSTAAAAHDWPAPEPGVLRLCLDGQRDPLAGRSPSPRLRSPRAWVTPSRPPAVSTTGLWSSTTPPPAACWPCAWPAAAA
jgi:hypothetical protein